MDPFTQKGRDTMAMCGTVAREEASGKVQVPHADTVSQAVNIEM